MPGPVIIDVFYIHDLERIVNPTANISEAELRRLIPAFYARVREDARLGPIFNDAIDDWPEHLDKLVDFWSSIMLTSGRYKGNPMAMHMKHRDRITPELFDQWLHIWRQTTDEMMAPQVAAALQAKAARIAESLTLGLFFRIDRPRRTPADAGTV